MNDPRASVLASVTDALRDASRARTEPPVVSIPESTVDGRELMSRFSDELAALKGIATIVPDVEACALALTTFLRERDVGSVAVQSSALATGVALLLEGFEVSVALDHDIHELARVDCGLLEARSLMADTGSAVLVLANAQDRVLPYLPRTCAIVARSASLRAAMSLQAFADIAESALSGARGEALIVAGPSRTADIEKELVLGAHGPQAVAVFIIQND